jgi:acyl transferase domain-containing protein/acyl carrier protein
MDSDPSHRERILLALQRARTKLEKLDRAANEPVAVIGAACRFPGNVCGIDDYWNLLLKGADAVTEVPVDRWDAGAYYSSDPQTPGKICTRYGAFLNAIDQFDPLFFGISEREAAFMDPQHRILLEVAWEAMENAGVSREEMLASRTGIFVGITSNDYAALLAKSMDEEDVDAYCSMALSPNSASGRIAFILGATGPALTIDTACSSSLVAVHLAVQSLRTRECDVALAGGVNLYLSPVGNIALSRAGMLSPDGRCKPFDAAANGYVRGEGCGVVMVKRLEDAVEARDHILAVIIGSAVNQNGRSSGFTVPNGPAQQALIRSALASARVDPRLVGYVEAHGTGTALGDPIEASALQAVFGRDDSDPLVIGSVKSNFGHLESAAGIAGFLKAVLVAERGQILPHLHFRKPNDRISWTGIRVPVETVKALDREGRCIVGVSSFGASGTNAHLILERAPQTGSSDVRWERPLQILAISARSREALDQVTARCDEALASNPDFPDFCFSINTRSHFPHRRCVVADSPAGAREELARAIAREAVLGGVPIVFATGRIPKRCREELYATSPAFRQIIDRHQGLIDDALLSAFALSRLWKAWGIVPDLVVGEESELTGVITGAKSSREVFRETLWDESMRIPVLAGRADEVPLLPSAFVIDFEKCTGWRSLLDSLGELFLRGVTVQWRNFDRDYSRRRISVPNYPFQRKRYWCGGVAATKDALSPVKKRDILELLWQGNDGAAWTQLAEHFPSVQRSLVRDILQTLAVPTAANESEWLYEIAWRSSQRSHLQIPNRTGLWIIFGGECSLGRRVAALIEARGERVALARYGQSLDALGNGEPIAGVLDLRGIEAGEETDCRSLRDFQESCIRKIFLLAQELVRTGGKLWLVTRGAQPVDTCPTHLAATPLNGLARAIAMEHPQNFGGHIDLNPASENGEAEELVQELDSPGSESVVAFRNGIRFVARLSRAVLQPPRALRFDGTYLITGGFGGLGLKVASWLVSRGARHLLLLGRSGPSPEAQAFLSATEQAGDSVIAASADVSRCGELQQLLESIPSDWPPLKGVFHAAGVLRDAGFLKQTWSGFEEVLRPKVYGAWNLHVLTQSMPLDFFALFSSIASLFGSAGQANYASANAFLDGLAHYRRSLRLPCLAINWGPWAERGMATHLAPRHEWGRTAYGIRSIPPDAGLRALEMCIVRRSGQLGVLPVDWEILGKELESDRIPAVAALARDLLPATAPSKAELPILERLNGRPRSLQVEELTAFLKQLIGKSLGSPSVDPESPFSELGIDSITATELQNRLLRQLRVEVPIRMLLTGATVTELSDWLLDRIAVARLQVSELDPVDDRAFEEFSV